MKLLTVNMKNFIREYLNRGFGSMNKNDFEVYIFSQLLKDGWNSKSNYEISIELKIPVQRVKRLRYEAELKYSNRSENDYRLLFLSCIQQAKLQKNGEIIKFSVEDLSLRNYLDSQLKRAGRFADSSFNSEIISLTIDDFIYLLETFTSQADRENTIKQLNAISQKNDTLFKDAILTAIKGFTTGLGTSVGNFTCAGIIALFKQYLN